jgi:dTDP-4-dehydrorhamnose reductase
MTSRSLLITGASGLLGSNLVFAACERVSVVAATHHTDVNFPCVKQYSADLTCAGEVERLFDLAEPRWIVHCAAMAGVDACEEDPDRAVKVNTDLPAAIAGSAERHEVKLIHISTDAVFSGRAGEYVEEDRPEPVNWYGRTKLAAESAVLERCPGAIVLRTNFYGWNLQPKQSIAEWFLSGLKRGETLPGFKDVFVGPLCVNDLCEWIMEMLTMNLSGIYHLVAQDCVSKLEFGRSIARTFDLDEQLIRPISVVDAGLKAARPRSLCLKNEKIRKAMGKDPGTVVAGIMRFKQLWNQGYPGKLKGIGPLASAE